MDGTCTGEHGVGVGKRNALEKEHGEAIDLMRANQTRPGSTKLNESGQSLFVRIKYIYNRYGKQLEDPHHRLRLGLH